MPAIPRKFSVAGIVLAVVAGAWLRLDQFLNLTLQDDEWHVVHRLLAGQGPGELFTNLGVADYSIPLGLLYWLESRWFGLSELAMRWPMMLAGLAALAMLPAHAWSRFSPRVTVLFAFLLATSPLLVAYSRMARPYSLTVLLVCIAAYTFHRGIADGVGRTAWRAAFCGSASLAVWLHPLVLPLLAGFPIQVLVRARFAGCAAPWRPLARMLLPAALLMAMLLVPPLVLNPQALAAKSGRAMVSPDTVTGALHLWFGTSSLVGVVGLGGLALLGFRRVVRDPVVQSLLWGLGLTLIAVLAARPAWVQNPLTFARYLLPLVPILLLAAACGADRLLDSPRPNRYIRAAAMSFLVLFCLHGSPLRQWIRVPNSNGNHLQLLFDFREGRNAHLKYLEEHVPVSPFWSHFQGLEPASLKIAVAPFYFESFLWDGVRWEQRSRQRVVAAYVLGYCGTRPFGEVPRNDRFRFRNVFYLSDLLREDASLPDWLVFRFPPPAFAAHARGRRELEVGAVCAERLRADLGTPDYADGLLMAFRLPRGGP